MRFALFAPETGRSTGQDFCVFRRDPIVATYPHRSVADEIKNIRADRTPTGIGNLGMVRETTCAVVRLRGSA